MAKKITDNQLLGELGEAAVKARFLSFGFQFDGRSRLEAGIDGIAEVMLDGEPLAKMIAVQVKSTESGKYTSETDEGFTYLLKEKDLEYWEPSNLPVIVVLYRQSDDSFFWKDVTGGVGEGKRQLRFDKKKDILNGDARDRLAALTVPKNGLGYYVPPLGSGEDALVNLLPVSFPEEMFIASTPFTPKKAIAKLLNADEPARFDWVIKGGSFWSFHDPRDEVTREIVDLDQVEAIDTETLAFHEDLDESNTFAYLLRMALEHQVCADLSWGKARGIFYFRAEEEGQSRRFYYQSAKNRTDAKVVTVKRRKADPDKIDYVRHHAFRPRFEKLLDQWFLYVTPTYHFTFNGFAPHSHPDALLSGKKRMDNNASLRGQLIMWHRFLTEGCAPHEDLFSSGETPRPVLSFGEPPSVQLPTKVPEDVWGTPKRQTENKDNQTELELHEA